MSEHTTQTVKAQIQSLINLANTTTGNTDTNLTDGVNALVSGYGQGGIQLPDNMLEGLENGYDVMFYDENNMGLAFYSIKQGHTINPPVYNCKSWQTSDGANVDFPYTPSADVIFYANNDEYVSQLYEHFGINPTEYPYVLIYQSDLSASQSAKGVAFMVSPTIAVGINSLLSVGTKHIYSKDSTIISGDNFFIDLFNYIMNLSASLLKTVSTQMSFTWTGNAYINSNDFESLNAFRMV